MKILAYVHLYHPTHNAGAEAMMHQILLEMKARGHEPIVACRTPGASEYQGIQIVDADDMELMKELVSWCDVVFTHLDLTQKAIKFAKSRFKPVVHLIHNDSQVNYHRLNYKTAQLFVANSEWIKKTIKVQNVPTIVVYPPTNPKTYSVKPSGKYVTLINMNENKGGKIFWQLARIMPDVQFLGVKGAYGVQETYDKELPNVKIIENTPDIKSIYKQSRIVLMPSAYESWGRVAIEAGASGIPVIASPTPGLKESLADAGIFIERGDVASYVEAIRMLDDQTVYDKYSAAMKARSKEIFESFGPQIDELENQLEAIAKRYRRVLPENY